MTDPHEDNSRRSDGFHLPEDIAAWPTDPWKVLGLAQGTDFRVIRKQYAKLIRRFKPEHHPREFRRVRDAFESVSRTYGQFAGPVENDGRFRPTEFTDPASGAESSFDCSKDGSSASPSDVQSDGPSVSDGGQPGKKDEKDLAKGGKGQFWKNEMRERAAQRGNDAGGDAADNADRAGPDELPDLPDLEDTASLKPPARPASIVDRLGQIWQRAREGQVRGAYESYLGMLNEAGDKPEIYLCLYWLTTFYPDLDPRQRRLDWLAEGMTRTKLATRLVDIAVRELEAAPHRADDPIWEPVLRMNAPSDRFLNFLSARWRAFGILGRWQLIADEFEQFRPRLELAHRRIWMRMTLMVLDHLVWVDDDDARGIVSHLREELDHCGAERAELEHDLLRSDVLCELEHSCSRLEISASSDSPWSTGFYVLIRDSWNEPIQRLREPWLKLLGPLVRSPISGLAELDRVARQHPLLVHFISDKVSRLHLHQFGYGASAAPEGVASEVLGLCEARQWINYPTLRSDVARYCLRREITVTQFIANLSVSTRKRLERTGLLDSLERDSALSCLMIAQRLIGGAPG